VIEILKITALETFSVRHPVLRKGMPLESCQFEGDDLPDTRHYGLFEDQKLAGVISLFARKNDLFSEEKQMQIRGMAVLDLHQKKGYGKLLVAYCEEMLRKENQSLIWFNARENAVGFYKKMGYQIIGTPFEVETIGLHYVMYKKL
jgi:GNAT superfamily N-acetyltransferase